MDTQRDMADIIKFAQKEAARKLEPDMVPLSNFSFNEKELAKELWSIYSNCFDDDLDKRRFNAIARQIIKGDERNISHNTLNNFTTIIKKFYAEKRENKIFSDWGIILTQKGTKIKSWKSQWDAMNSCLKSYWENELQRNYWLTLGVIAHLFCDFFTNTSTPYDRMSLLVWVKFVFRKYLDTDFTFPLWNRIFSKNIVIEVLGNDWELLAQIFHSVLIAPNDSRRSQKFLLENKAALRDYKFLKKNIDRYDTLWNNSAIRKYLEDNEDFLNNLYMDLNISKESIFDIWRKSVIGIAIEGCEQFIGEYEKAFLRLTEQEELKIELFTLITHLSFGLASYKEWEGQKNGKLGGRGNKKLQV